MQEEQLRLFDFRTCVCALNIRYSNQGSLSGLLQKTICFLKLPIQSVSHNTLGDK